MKLYICEKPKTARQLVTALGGTFRKIQGAGNTFAGHYESAECRVTYLLGHFYSLLEPHDINPDLKQWRLQDLPIIHREARWKPACDGSSDQQHVPDQIAHIQSLYDSTSEVCIATDADQEGQVIGQVFVEQSGWTGKTNWLCTNTWEEASLRERLSSIRPNENFIGFYEAGIARIISDQAVGINFTRLFTLLARMAGHDMVANIGRVRSPSMAIIVDHEAVVNGHSANLYWTLQAKLSAGQSLVADLQLPDGAAADGKHCVDRALMESLLASTTGHTTARVISVKENENVVRPPAPFTQNTLSQFCADQYGLMPQEVMDISQQLYEGGYISYPRTESAFYEIDVLAKAPSIMAALDKLGGSFSSALMHTDINQPQPVFANGEVDSHCAIFVEKNTPDLSKLSHSENQVYHAIAMRFLAQFARPFISASQKMIFGIGTLSFAADSTTIKSLGWAEILPKSSESTDALPPLRPNDTVNIISVEMIERKTKSPPRLTVSKFQSILEDCTHLLSPNIRERIGRGQLGTQATQSSYIDTLVNQNVIQVQEKKYLVSTKRGRELRRLLPEIIASPNMTSLWELRFRAIRARQETGEQFLDAVFAWLSKTIEELKSVGYAKSPIMTACELCGSAMNRRQSKTDATQFFWVCSNTESCNSLVSDYKGRPLELLPGHGESCSKCGKVRVTRVRKNQAQHNNPDRFLSCGTPKCNGEAK